MAIDEVVGLVVLEHQPHRFHVVAGETPVTLGVEVAEAQLGGLAVHDVGDSPW